MMRPRDAGKRTEEELRDMMPRFRDMTPPMARMVRGLPAGFDVNVGNLPYCVAPEIAPWVHHDGERTENTAIDGDDRLSRPWDKYLVKRTDKIKTPRCASCAFDAKCSGVFDRYAGFHGATELVPIRLLEGTTLEAVTHSPRPWLRPALAAALGRIRAAAPFGTLRWVEQRLSPERAELVLESPPSGDTPGPRAVFFLDVRPAARPASGYRVEGTPDDALREGLGALLAALRGPAPAQPAHP
jgi:hypothetical protein